MKKNLIRALPFIFIALLSIWAGKGLFKYNIFSTHDGNHHIARSFDAIATLSEGHFPLRWAGTLNYGCGVPIFNFFYPLIYYLVALLYPLFDNVIHTLKIIDLATFFVGTLFFYLWIKKELKDARVALSASILYLFAPYRFLLVFVRGSPEFMAYAILPIVLYLYACVFEEKSMKKFAVLSFLAGLVGGLLTISHNFTVMFLMPIILIYLLVKTLKNHKMGLTRILLVLFSFISAFGFGAFFVFPAILEEKFTQIGTPRFLYKDHFPALWQLLRSKWDYFYSAVGTQLDGMSFQLGYAQWAVLGLVAIWLSIILTKVLIRRKAEKNFISNYIWIIIFFILSAGSIFLMLDVSTPVWEKIALLQKIQFPWRILGISVFLISALFPFWLIKIKNRFFYWSILIAIPLLAFLGNRNHLLPQPIVPWEVHLYDDFEKLHYHRYTTTTFDNDIVAPSAKGSCWFETPLFATEKEQLEYEKIKKGSTYGAIKFQIDNPKGKYLMFALGYYPSIYNFELNGQRVGYKDCEGRVCVDINNTQKGLNYISWKIVQTPVQSIFNYVTAAFLVIWLVIIFLFLSKAKIKKHHLILLLIFLIFAFFRFYNLDKRVGFGWDQERDANAVADILSGDIKLIGPRVLGDKGFFLPPYFFYLLAPFYKLTALSPYSGVLFLYFYNLVFFFTAYKVMKKLFNQKTALLFLAIWAANPHLLSMDTIAWNPLLIPLVFMLILNFLKGRGAFLLGLLYGFGTSLHAQFLLIFPLFLPMFLRDRKKILPLLAGAVLVFLPIAIFDLKNDFLNFRLLGEFSTGVGGDYLAFLPVWNNVVSRLLGTEAMPLVSIVFYLIITAMLFVRRKESVWQNLFYVWISFPVFFAFYGSRPSEYYFNYLIVIVCIVFSHLLSNLKKSLVVAGVVFLFFTFKSTQQLQNANFGLYKKDQIVGFLADITRGGSPFNITFSLGDEGDVGFRYIFLWRGVKFTGDSKDPLIQLTAPPPATSAFVVNGVGIVLPQHLRDEN